MGLISRVSSRTYRMSTNDTEKLDILSNLITEIEQNNDNDNIKFAALLIFEKLQLKFDKSNQIKILTFFSKLSVTFMLRLLKDKTFTNLGKQLLINFQDLIETIKLSKVKNEILNSLDKTNFSDIEIKLINFKMHNFWKPKIEKLVDENKFEDFVEYLLIQNDPILSDKSKKFLTKILKIKQIEAKFMTKILSLTSKIINQFENDIETFCLIVLRAATEIRYTIELGQVKNVAIDQEKILNSIIIVENFTNLIQKIENDESFEISDKNLSRVLETDKFTSQCILSVIQDLSESETRIKINLNDKINGVSSDPLNIIDRTKNVENYSEKLTNANEIDSKSVFDNFGQLMMESISRVLAQ